MMGKSPNRQANAHTSLKSGENALGRWVKVGLAGQRRLGEKDEQRAVISVTYSS
jgi:hypothetical protein